MWVVSVWDVVIVAQKRGKKKEKKNSPLLEDVTSLGHGLAWPKIHHVGGPEKVGTEWKGWESNVGLEVLDWA